MLTCSGLALATSGRRAKGTFAWAACLQLLLGAAALTGCSTDRRSDNGPDAAATAYERYCAVCHGADGLSVAGTGSPSLNNPALLAAASDEFLYQNVARGRPGTTMTTWLDELGGPLSEAQIRDILGYVRTWGAFVQDTAALTQQPGDPVRGRGIFDRRCAGCHGTDGISVTAPDLANPTFQSTADDTYIRRAIRDGRPGTDMAAFADLVDQDVANLIAHIRDLGRPGPP